MAKQRQAVGVGRNSKKVKKTISVSPATDLMAQDLDQWTDAATESEVYRNAIRIHHLLVKAHQEDKPIRVGDDLLPPGALSLFR